MFVMQVKVREGDKYVWKSVRPTSGEPYKFATYEEAYNMLNWCYPLLTYGIHVQVAEE
jgi:hypothetical protein